MNTCKTCGVTQIPDTWFGECKRCYDQSVFSTCKECGEDERTDDLNDAMLCRLCACTHERVECPRHEGNFDCNSFCRLCEGEQEWCPTCDTHEHEWDTTSERTHCLVCGAVE